MIAAADQEADVAPLDGEGLRGGRALGLVAALERVDQPTARKAADRLLPGFGAVGRALAEGVPVIVQPS